MNNKGKETGHNNGHSNSRQNSHPQSAPRHENSQQQAQPQYIRPTVYTQTHLRQNPPYPPPGAGLQQTGLVHDMNKPPFPQQQGLAVSAPGQQTGATAMVYTVPNRSQLNPNAASANIQQSHGNQQYYARGNGGAGANAQNQGGNQGPPRHVQQNQRTAGLNMPLTMLQGPQTGQPNAQQNFYGGAPAPQMYLTSHMGQPTHLMFSQHNHQQHATMPGPVEFQPPNEALSVSMIPPHSSSTRYTIENGEMNSPAMYNRYSSTQFQAQQPAAVYVSQPSAPYLNPYNVYQSQMLSMHPQGNRPGIPPAVVNPAPQAAPPPKRAKNIIRIVDPNTQIDVTDDVLSNAGNNPTPPNSGASSARGTPPSNVATPPPDAGEIAAQFARQVAAAASSTGSGAVVTQPPSQLQVISPQSQSSSELAANSASSPSVSNSSTSYSSNRTKGEKDVSANISRGIVAERIVTNSNSIINDTQDNSINAIATKDCKIVNKIEAEVPPPVIVKTVEKIESKLPVLVPSAHPPPSSAPNQSVRSAAEIREQGSSSVVHPPAAATAKKSECAPPPPFPTSKISNPSEVSAHVAPFGALSSSIISATDKMAGTPFSSSQVIVSAPPDHLPSRDTVNEPGLHHVTQGIIPPPKTGALVPAPFTQQQGQGQQSAMTKPSSSQVIDSGRLSGNHPPVTPSPFGQAQPQQPLLLSQVHKQQNGDVQTEISKANSFDVEGITKDSKQHSQPTTGSKAVLKKNKDFKGKTEQEKRDVEERNDAPVIATVEEPVTEPSVPQIVANESEEILVSSPDNEELKVTEDMLEKEAKRKVTEKNEENSKVCPSPIETAETDSEAVNDVPSTQFKLKYEYKSDQWSPINLEGKKQYDRDFLLRIQTEPPSLRKPDGLPNLEVIRDDVVNTMNLDRIPAIGIINKPRGGGAVNDFIPGFVHNNNKPPMRARGSQQGRKEPLQQPPKKVLSISLCQEVNLRNAESPWVPSYKQKSKTEDVEDLTEKLNRKIRALLNKLTPQNFQSLMDQVKNSAIDTEGKMFGVIELVFEKAIDEPNFSVAYANMCKALSAMKVPSANGETVDFRKLIIGRCQTEFEKDANEESRQREEKQKIIDAESDPEKKKILQEELKEAISIVRRRSLGNIRFIGELFKLKMLTSKIMHECVRKLLNESDEESYECLCRLLTTIGKDLEFPTPNKPPIGSNKSQPQTRDIKVDDYFVQMANIVKSRQTTSRVRFMLQDVIDLRAKNWIPRRDENNPKTIDQIHREAEAEEHEKQLLYQTNLGKREDRMDRRGGPNMGGKRGNSENEGWNTVGSGRKASITPMPDTSKCKMRMENLDENNIQLGPQTSGWSKGSMGGRSNHDGDRPPQNRYALLSSGEHSQGENRRMQPRQQTPHSMSGRDNRNLGGSVSQQLPMSNHRGGGYKGSYSREHEQAIANVKNIANNESSGRSSNNMHQKPPSSGSRSNSVNREVSRESRSVESEVDLDKLENKVKDIVDEYLNNVDVTDAVENVVEYVPASKMSYFVTLIFNNYLEKNAKARTNIGELLSELVIKTKLSLDQFWKGMNDILELTEEMAIDIPKFWEYLAEIIAPLFQTEVLNLCHLKTIVLPILREEQTGKLLAHILKVISAVSTAAAVKLWQSSKLNIGDFVPVEKVDQFIERYKLNFLVDEAGGTITFLSKESLLNSLKKELKASVYTEGSQVVKRYDKIFTWIKENVPEQQQNDPTFIRALVTAIAERSVNSKAPDCYDVNLPILKACCTVIKRYVDNKDVLELETLFALQRFVHHLEHPKGLLHSFFSILYDEETVSDEGFLSWKAAEGQEVEGHAVAVKAVNSFLGSFKQSEDDDEST